MSERQSLLLAGIAHIALFAALSLGFAMTRPDLLPPDDPIPVEIVDIAEVARVTEPPKPSIEAAPQETVEATAPEPEPKPPAPAPAPEPEPAPPPEPKAEAPKPPPPVPPKPKAEPKPAPPKPEKAKPAPQRLDAQELSNLLDKSLPKAKTRPLDTDALAKSIEKALPRTARVDARATATLVQAIRAQVAPCWNPPIGGSDVKQMTVVLRIEMNRDGSVVGRPDVVSQTGVTSGNGDYARAFAETARRAVLRCAPLKLPAELYDAWKSIELNFDPSEMA